MEMGHIKRENTKDENSSKHVNGRKNLAPESIAGIFNDAWLDITAVFSNDPDNQWKDHW